MKICRSFGHGLKMCMRLVFSSNPNGDNFHELSALFFFFFFFFCAVKTKKVYVCPLMNLPRECQSIKP